MASQWKLEVSKAAEIVSDWLVQETASIRASDAAYFVTNWAVKGGTLFATLTRPNWLQAGLHAGEML